MNVPAMPRPQDTGNALLAARSPAGSAPANFSESRAGASAQHRNGVAALVDDQDALAAWQRNLAVLRSKAGN